MAEPSSTTNAASCPLCGDANQCAMAADPSAKHCWCVDVTIAPEALVRVPAEARGVICICSRCASGAPNPR